MFKDISNMSMFAGLSVPVNNGVVDPEYVPNESDLMNILKEIFAVDPVSGLPKGDIAYYLSPNGNPQVKLWLENNLLKPRAVSIGSSVKGVSDDLIAECQRGTNESGHDYAIRMKSIFDSAVEEINKTKVNNNE